MPPLDKSLRNQLERTIKEARIISEAAAKAALDQLGVGETKPYSHLTGEDRKIRIRLRAHGRQLEMSGMTRQKPRRSTGWLKRWPTNIGI